MAVLQFAFSGDSANSYLPHNYEPDTVVFTGTHDNDTTRGWYDSASEAERDFARRYLGTQGTDIAWDLIRLGWESVARMAVIPLQDVLDLGSEARMNFPSRPSGNWTWRVREEQLTLRQQERLAELSRLYGRGEVAPEAEQASAPI
jgi:4-alpha-glucanotransferase